MVRGPGRREGEVRPHRVVGHLRHRRYALPVLRKEDFNEDISRWNVSNVQRMDGMFLGATSFNGDLSRWEVGQVEDMDYMAAHAISFDRQLNGAWATSTASKYRMFFNSPGTIAGKAKDANGTVA